MLRRLNQKHIKYICIPTNNRPHELLRCLNSIKPHINIFKEKIKIVISDDSDNSVTSSMFSEFAKDCGHSIAIYIGRSEKRALSALIARETGIRPETLSLCLNGLESTSSYGANQNTLHIFTSGSCAVFTDDDVVFDVRQRDTEFDIGGASDLEEQEVITFYNCREQVKQAGRPSALNPFTELEAGLNAGDMVMAAVPGIYGDTGATSSAHLLANQNTATWKSISACRLRYKLARETREQIRQVARSTEVPLRPFMTTSYALDNRTPSAPFIPILRGSDYIFSRMFSMLNPGALLACRAFSCGHEPPQGRTNCGSVAQWRMVHLMSSLISDHCKQNSQSNEHFTISNFGRHLRQLHTLSVSEFLKILYGLRNRYLEDVISSLLNQLDSAANLPDYYIDDVVSEITHAERAIATQASGLPEDFFPEKDIAIRGRDLRHFFDLMAEMYVGWGDIITAAKRSISPSLFLPTLESAR